jgi:hypothetical protein
MADLKIGRAYEVEYNYVATQNTIRAFGEALMGHRKNGPIRVIQIRKGESRRSVYAKVKKSFTAKDLQRYTRDEQMVPAQKLVAELETIHKDEAQNRNRKRA